MIWILILAGILLWLMIGHLVCALGRWGYPYETEWWDIVLWPTRLWFTICHLLHDWRTDLYYRNKHR